MLLPPEAKTLKLERIGGRATEDEMVGWHHRLMYMSLSRLREVVKDRDAAVHEVAKSQTQLSD